MYVSGTLVDYQGRLHQLAVNQEDLDDYLVEGRDYLSGVGAQISGKWEDECRRIKFEFSQSGVVLNQQQF